MLYCINISCLISDSQADQQNTKDGSNFDSNPKTENPIFDFLVTSRVTKKLNLKPKNSIFTITRHITREKNQNFVEVLNSRTQPFKLNQQLKPTSSPIWAYFDTVQNPEKRSKESKIQENDYKRGSKNSWNIW